MDKKKEQWMEDVFTSMQGSKRAIPKPELFSEITYQFKNWEVIDFRTQWRFATIAAIFVLLINSTVLIYYIRQQKANNKSVQSMGLYHKLVTSSYQIY